MKCRRAERKSEEKCAGNERGNVFRSTCHHPIRTLRMALTMTRSSKRFFPSFLNTLCVAQSLLRCMCLCSTIFHFCVNFHSIFSHFHRTLPLRAFYILKIASTYLTCNECPQSYCSPKKKEK